MVTKKARSTSDDLRGASRLAIEAICGVTSLVEAMHRTIGGGPETLGRPLAGVTRILTAPVYASVREVASAVGAGLDLALARFVPLLDRYPPGREREVVLAALNGVLGDYLVESGNSLAIEMRLRHGGAALDLERDSLRATFPDVRRRLLVLVHGSSMNDLQWTRRGHNHGLALAADLGMTPLYLHYNSGLHVSTNGRTLATLLEQLVGAWPVPLDEVFIVAHSMGGLVARSACHAGEAAGHKWRALLRALVTLGSPHHGAPLERGGNWIDVLLGMNRYSAPLAALGKIRSAGVTDMRFGNVLDEHWQGRDRFEPGTDVRTPLPLPASVACFAIAATTTGAPGERLAGDGLVPVDSALGRHRVPALTLGFPAGNVWIGYGMNHRDLLSRADVYASIRDWLSSLDKKR
jgi:pimeloyl-ACP methyl ester carboxylesterase